MASGTSRGGSSDIANITKKIVKKIEDIGTDIYQASLPAEALQNANRSKTKATFGNHLLLIINFFTIFLQI